MMYDKDYVLREIERSEQFAADRKYILDYCLRIRHEKNKLVKKDEKQVSDDSRG